MSDFLIVYRRSTGELLRFEDLGSDHEGALARRLEMETREKGDPDVEVVLLSSPSREALTRTHARYFKSMHQIAVDLGQTLAS
jgi:hypothetical protein